MRDGNSLEVIHYHDYFYNMEESFSTCPHFLIGNLLGIIDQKESYWIIFLFGPTFWRLQKKSGNFCYSNGVKFFSVHKDVEGWMKEIKYNFQFFSHVTISMSLDAYFVPIILFSIFLPLKPVFRIPFKSFFFFPVKPLHYSSAYPSLSYLEDGWPSLQYPSGLHKICITAVIRPLCT